MRINIKKLENFWYYYKTHTIASVLIIVLTLSVAIFSHTKDHESDVVISYINKKLTPLKSVEDIEENLSVFVCDVNKDHLRKVSVLNVIDSFQAGFVLQAGQADIHLCNRARIENTAKTCYIHYPFACTPFMVIIAT